MNRPESKKKESLPMGQRIFAFCGLIFLGAVALAMAVEIIKCILPWLIGAAVVAIVIAAFVIWHKRRSDNW